VNFLADEVGAGVEVSAVTVGRILSRNGITRKVVERAFLTRNLGAASPPGGGAVANLCALSRLRE